MGGSQGGSQTSPAGKVPLPSLPLNPTNTPQGVYGRDNLRPCTILQVLQAQQPHPDAEFKIDDVEITQVTFVGQIRNISSQATNVTYKLDDGTGTIEVKLWIDADANGVATEHSVLKPKLVENEWARVWGRLRAFNNRRHVGAHVIRPVVDKMEITYHLLEATYVHLYFTRGPLDTDGKASTGQANAQQQYGAGNDDGMTAPNGKSLPPISPNARKVFQSLNTMPQNNEGLHMQQLAAELNMSIPEVAKAGDELLSNSLIFTTVDDSTWAVLEI